MASETDSYPAYHVPVLLKESVDGLNIHDGGVYVDVTFGGGGHSSEILSRMPEGCRLFSFDQDADAVRNMAGKEVFDDRRFTFVHSNFRFLHNWMHYYGIGQIDGLLADLGVSSHHFDDGGRGFSFRQDGPLDMRMNRDARETAAGIVNGYSPDRLAQVLFLYGELRDSRRLASAIVRAREEKALSTTRDLADAVTPCLRRGHEKKELARIFQALRIEVNHEMAALEEMLLAATRLLKAGGRLSVITYHSLEDRIVKNIMRTGNAGGTVLQDFYGRAASPYRWVSKNVITPSEEEQRQNPRSRSAKLRIAERNDNE